MIAQKCPKINLKCGWLNHQYKYQINSSIIYVEKIEQKYYPLTQVNIIKNFFFFTNHKLITNNYFL